MKRWQLLEREPALSRSNWLPTGDAWPELAERHAQHERLLGSHRGGRAGVVCRECSAPGC